MKNKPKESKTRAGYRIHFERLRNIRANVSTIRTHKFKCEIPQGEGEKEIKGKFADVAKVVDSSEKGSLLWFLIQLYGLGFLFVSSSNKKEILLSKLPNAKSQTVEVFRSQLKESDFEYKDLIKDDLALFEFVTTPIQKLSEKAQNNHLPNLTIEILRKIFNPKEKKIKGDSVEEWLSANTEIKEVHDDIHNLIKDFASNEAKKKKIKTENINEDQEFLSILQKYFGVKIHFPDTKKTTFVIQEIPLEELKKNAERIDIYAAYFRYLSTAAQKTGYDVQSLSGASENQNALSNLFGKSFKEFQESEDKCKVLLKFGNPEYFANHSEELDFLARTVHELSGKVENALNVDFIAEGWNEYRGLFGGRLQGWLSNFQNRLEVFEESLFDEEAKEGRKIIPHKKIFDQIDENCNWKSIFPENQKTNFEKLRDLQPQLRDALKAIKGEVNLIDAKKDFGSLLDEYNQYLQGFREFLMKWNNEGIDKFLEKGEEKKIEIKIVEKQKTANTQAKILPSEFEIFNNLLKQKPAKKLKKDDEENEGKKDENNKKEIIGCWSRDFIPSDLDRYPRFIGQAKKDPAEEIKKAYHDLFEMSAQALKLVKIIRNGSKKIEDFSEKKWLKGKKEADFGLFQKHLETIKKLAERYDSKQLVKSKSLKFLEKFVDLESSTDEEQKKNWNKKNLSKIKFFVSGYEYRNKNFLSVKSKNFSDYLSEFEDHFELQNIESAEQIKNWLGFQDGNISWFTNENGEMLKTYFSLLLRDLCKEITLPNSQENLENLAKTSLAGLIFNEKNELKSGVKIHIANIRRFFASSVGSEIRSKISILSRKEFVKRNVIQTTNGKQSMLRYVPIEWGNFDHLKPTTADIFGRKIFKKGKKRFKKIRAEAKKEFSQKSLESLASIKIEAKKTNQEIAESIWKIFNKQEEGVKRKLAQVLAEMPHRWEIVLKTSKKIDKLSEVEEEILVFEKKQGGTFGVDTDDVFRIAKSKEKNFLYSFPIQTSVYQKQFLERFLWGDQKQILNEKVMGSSVIIEEVMEVKWQNNELKIQPKKNSFAFYCAIPFQISKKESEVKEKRIIKDTEIELKNSDEKSQKQYRNEEKFLGIDLGEYGFGWAILDPIKAEEEAQKQLEGKEYSWKRIFEKSGFQEIPLLKKMRDEAASWRDAQSRGIFSRPTTYLAELREQAAGQTRNQIHRLALEYKAIPIYEDSVDGFESGGQRISKLYKTLKTADVISGVSNDADKAVRKHFWGIDSAQIGGVIGASKTSQTCRNCGRCATSEIEEKIKNSSKEEIKKAQRVTNPEKPERGGGALFVCQICANKSDADEQAAQNIALKYFFMKSKKLQKEREEFAKKLEEKLKKKIGEKEVLEDAKDQKNKGQKKNGSNQKPHRITSISLPFFLEKSKEKKWQIS